MDEPILLGKVALVTGGAVRIGRAISLALASHGADVLLHYHSSAEQAQLLATGIQQLGRQCHLIGMDLSHPETPQAVFDFARKHFDAVDILINSASIFPLASLPDTTVELWDQTLDINLRAPFLLARCFAGQTKVGNIVNIIDGRIASADPDHLAYAVSKAGLAYLTKSLAVALAPGIRVNGVAPGAILPPSNGVVHAQSPLLDSIPLGRLGSPTDITQAILFLLASPYITGDILQVTGGQFLA
jgi:pteridine reductase